MKLILEWEHGSTETYISLIGRFDDGKEKVSVLVVERCTDAPTREYFYELEADDAEEGSVDHTYMKQLIESWKTVTE